MSRASMAQLIAIVRLKTGFPSGGTPAFTDDQIQDVLDAHRCDVRYELLTPAPDIQPGQGSSAVSNFVWAVYLSDFQYWESSLAIATPPAQFPPVYATGKVYDIFRASAELLLMGIASLAFNLFNMTIDGRNLQLNQIVTNWEKLANFYFAQSWPTTIKLQRSDVAAGESSGSSMLGDKSDWTTGGLLPSAFGQGVTTREEG